MCQGYAGYWPGQLKLPAEDSQRLRTAAEVIWEDEAAKSDRNLKAIDILNKMLKRQGVRNATDHALVTRIDLRPLKIYL